MNYVRLSGVTFFLNKKFVILKILIWVYLRYIKKNKNKWGKQGDRKNLIFSNIS